MGMDIYGKNADTYFRASCWSWRPIHQLCEQLNKQKHLDLSFTDWSSNNSAGFYKQADCDKLANALEQHIKETNMTDLILEPDCRVDENGVFLSSSNKTDGRSAYYTDREHVESFIKFLRECGGSFEIC